MPRQKCTGKLQTLTRRASTTQDAECNLISNCNKNNPCGPGRWCNIDFQDDKGFCQNKKSCAGTIISDAEGTYDDGKWNTDKKCIVDVYNLQWQDCWGPFNDTHCSKFGAGWTNAVSTPIPRANGKNPLCISGRDDAKCPAGSIAMLGDDGKKVDLPGDHVGNCFTGTNSDMCYKKA